MKTIAYGCFNKDTIARQKASSGGIYALIAQNIISKGGVVFAVCYDEKFETYHTKIDSIENLSPSYGSKYVPSKLGNTFTQVKENLLDDKWVLFVGTPCQCGGLLSFLGKSYDKLICVDFVCHGVPSRNAWRSYLESIKIKDNKELTSLNMRDKSSGWSNYQYSWKMNYSNKEVTLPQSNVMFMKGFVADIYLRPSCYECRFKGTTRSTDFTLGDYWGVWNLQPEIDDNKGTSIVFIHSQKGKDLFNEINSNIKFQEANIDKVVECNPSIIKSAHLPNKRSAFFKELKSDKPFDKIVEELTKVSFINKVKRKGKSALRKVLKKTIKK